MKRHIGILTAVLVCSMHLCSQTTLQRRPEQPQEYVLGPGDQIVLHVADMDDMPQGPIKIDPTGLIDLPLVGRVQAGGLTVDQLHEEIAGKLSKYVHSPDITINLAGMESRPVSVVGEVSNPGIHQLTGPTRLLDVISLCGGLKPDAGPTLLGQAGRQRGQVGPGDRGDDHDDFGRLAAEAEESGREPADASRRCGVGAQGRVDLRGGRREEGRRFCPVDAQDHV